MDLRNYLRIKINSIKKMNIKGECECCGSKSNLALHHNIQFSELLYDVLQELDLEFMDTKNYSNNELQNIVNLFCEKHMNIQYTTLCSECHKLIHTGSYLKEHFIDEYKNRNKKIIGYEFIYTGKHNLLFPEYDLSWDIDEYQTLILLYMNGFNSLNGVNCTLSDIILKSNKKINRNKGKTNDLFRESVIKLLNRDILRTSNDIETIGMQSLINFKINTNNLKKIKITYEMILMIKKMNKIKIKLLMLLYIHYSEIKYMYTSLPIFISKKTDFTTSYIIKALEELQEDGILKLKYSSNRKVTP